MLSHLKQTLLSETSYAFDQVYMTLNSIIEFIFEAFKRDG